jgi:hypothetical protein
VAWLKYGYDFNAKRMDATQLLVFDADGKNESKLLTVENDGQNTRLLGWFPAKPADARKRNAPVPKAAPPEGVIVVSSFSKEKPLEVVKPDGTPVKVIKPDGWFNPWRTRLAADGKRAVTLDMPLIKQNPVVKHWTMQSIRLVDPAAVEAKPTAIAEEVYNPSVAITADGKSVFYSHIDIDKLGTGPAKGENLPFESWVYDTATEKKTRLKLPPEHAVVDVSADGKTLLTRTTEHQAADEQLTLCVTTVAELKPVKLFEAAGNDCLSPRLSPDGKRVLYVKVKEWPIQPVEGGPFIRDVATGKEVKVPLPDADTLANSLVSWSACWSPDGKRIALHWYLVDGKLSRDVAGRVTVFDLDGTNTKTILVRDQPGEGIKGLDWR